MVYDKLPLLLLKYLEWWLQMIIDGSVWTDDELVVEGGVVLKEPRQQVLYK